MSRRLRRSAYRITDARMSPLSVPRDFTLANPLQTQKVLSKPNLIPEQRHSIVPAGFQTFSPWQTTKPKQSAPFSARISFPSSLITLLLETALEQTAAFSTLTVEACRTSLPTVRPLTFFFGGISTQDLELASRLQSGGPLLHW